MTALYFSLKRPFQTSGSLFIYNKIYRLIIFLSLFFFASCSESELILPGDRISIIQKNESVEIDQQALSEGAGLPEPLETLDASHPGLNAGHAGGNVAIEFPLERRWDIDIGVGGDDLVELAMPVVSGQHVFTVSAFGQVSAVNFETGEMLWSVIIENFGDGVIPGISGGIAVSGSKVLVHGGGYNLTALSIGNGSVIWERRFQLPLRGGPTVFAKKAVAVTDLDSNLFMLNSKNGDVIWERAGLPSGTVVYGAPSPAIYDNQIVVAGNGGDISLLDANNANVIWTDSLAASNPRTPLQGLGDIRAHPVHDGGLIFAVSQSGRIGAYTVRSGLLLWDLPLGGIEMPWVAGKTVFLVTLDGRLYAIRRSDGAVRWVTALPGALPVGSVAAEEIPRYVGPIVVGGKVLTISKEGEVLILNADTGTIEDDFSVGGSIVTAPQTAAGNLFVLDNSGKLTAFD